MLPLWDSPALLQIACIFSILAFNINIIIFGYLQRVVSTLASPWRDFVHALPTPSVSPARSHEPRAWPVCFYRPPAEARHSCYSSLYPPLAIAALLNLLPPAGKASCCCRWWCRRSRSCRSRRFGFAFFSDNGSRSRRGASYGFKFGGWFCEEARRYGRELLGLMRMASMREEERIGRIRSKDSHPNRRKPILEKEQINNTGDRDNK